MAWDDIYRQKALSVIKEKVRSQDITLLCDYSIHNDHSLQMKQYMQKRGVREAPAPAPAALTSTPAGQSPALQNVYAQAEDIFKRPIGRCQASGIAKGIDALVEEEFNSWENSGTDDKHDNMCAFWSVSGRMQ